MCYEVVGLTFELTCPIRQVLTGRGRTIATMAWSGQAAPAVAGQVERGVSHTSRRKFVSRSDTPVFSSRSLQQHPLKTER